MQLQFVHIEFSTKRINILYLHVKFRNLTIFIRMDGLGYPLQIIQINLFDITVNIFGYQSN